MKLNWKDKNAKEQLDKKLDEIVNTGSDESIDISNIVSSEFYELYDIDEVTDFNGWQCDWWSLMHYKGRIFEVCGGAWYGTIEISLSDES